MVDADPATVLTLLSVAALGYFLVATIPRVDDMDRGYAKFAALTSLGIGYLVVLMLFLTVTAEGYFDEPVTRVMAIAVAGFLLLGVASLYWVADDWLRLFADPEFNTAVEASLLIAVIIVIIVAFLGVSLG